MLKRKRIKTPDAILVIIILLTIVIYILLSIKKEKPQPKLNFDQAFKELSIRKIDKHILHAAIVGAGEYLMNNIDEKGKFNYKRNVDTAQKPNNKYNTLRHAGSIYALCRYYEYSLDKDALIAAVKAADFLKKNMLKSLDRHNELIGVWSRGSINNDGDKDIIKLGGNGLGLLALATVEKLKPGFISADTLNMIGDFIVFMQKPNGGFYSKYFPGKKQRDDSWTSLYYPGEAALGLISLFELNKNEKYLLSAEKALNYLAKLRNGKLRTEADHWAIIATAHLFETGESLRKSANIRSHGIQISKSILLETPPTMSSSPFYGSLSNDARITPTATRMEGLLASLRFIPEERNSMIYSVIITANKGVGFLISSQIKEGELKGGIPRELILSDSIATAWNKKSDEKRKGEVRIDYVQHALCAMIQYDELFID